MNPVGILQGRLTPSNGRGIQFFPYENWENEFKLAREIGFDCIELLVKKNEFSKNPLSSPSGITRINELKKEFSLEILSVHGFYSKDPGYPEILKQLIDSTSQLGGKVILISFFDENILATEDDKKLALKQLKEPLGFASRYNIRLGIETELEAHGLKSFIDSFNHPAVGIYYDIGNMASMGVDTVKEIKFLGKDICGVHAKDRKVDQEESVPLGEGAANFPAGFRALKLIGYNGPFIIQGARKEGVDDIELNRHYFEYIKGILTQLSY